MYRPAVKLCSEVIPPALQHEQCRNFATLKDISVRLKSVKNIQKITQSMKMVSAAKFSRSERELKAARPFGEGAQAFYKQLDSDKGEKKPNHLIVAMTSDRGLCGAVHSSIHKMIRGDIEKNQNYNNKIICVGDKSKGFLQRILAKNIQTSINDIGKKPPTFDDARVLAETVLNSGIEFNQGEIYFNYFKSVVSYQTKKLPFMSLERIQESEKLTAYDSVDQTVLQSYMEFSMASLFFYVLKEASASEQSSRMTAMGNASKNAGEMISKLTLYYNRTRQAVITRELIEIISGAAAL